MSAYGQAGTQQQQQQQQHHHHHTHAPIHHHHHRPQTSQQIALQQHQQQQQQQQQHQHQHQQPTGVRYGRAVGSGRGIGLLANEQGMGNPGDEYLSLPSLDQTNSYTPIGTSHQPSGSSYDSLEQANPSASSGNRGNKLKKNSRWVRKGKAVAWGMSAGEREAEERLRAKLRYTLAHHLPPDSSRGRSPSRSLSPPLLPHLRSPSPPSVTSSHLSQLLSPPRSYTEIVLSPAMRYTFASGHLEDALGQTAGELIEGEIGLSRSLGRFFEECRERGIEKRDDDDGEEEEEEEEDEKEQELEEAAEEDASTTAAAPISSTPITNSTTMTEEISGERKEPDGDVESATQQEIQISENGNQSKDETSNPDEQKKYLNGSNRLPSDTSMRMDIDGLSASQPQTISALSSLPSTSHLSSSISTEHPPIQAEGDLHESEDMIDGPAGLDQQKDVQLSALEKLFVTPEGVSYPIPSQQGMDPNGGAMFLSVEMQKEALYRGMDALGELLADSREYVERLEEVRERLAGVGRARKRVWREIRERCLENGELGDGSTDS